jgi:vitamin B12 transporter
MKTTTPSRSALARRLLSLAGAALAAAAAQAQNAPAILPADATDAISGHDAVMLEPYVLSASRTPQDPKYTASSVTVFDNADLALSQISDLKTALAQQPGVNVKTTGALGGGATTFFRGLDDSQNLFLVDGVRMNTRSASATFLYSADLSSNDRIEILRGPQSALYGSSAMGGVTRIDTATGCGNAAGELSTTAGSFDTYGSAANVQGSARKLSYTASASGLESANELPRNEFSSWSYTSRLQYELSDFFYFGGTVRNQNANYQVVSGSPGDSKNRNTLGTLYADWHPDEVFQSRLTAALHRREYIWQDVGGSPDKQVNRREIFDWQNTWQATDHLEVAGGLTHELAEHDVNGGTNKSDPSTAEFVNLLGHPTDTLALTLGGRHEDLGDAGESKTWKAGAAWQVVSATKLRATYGTGFSAPSDNDVIENPSWGVLANPNLKPEQSRGWDVGVDQELIPKAISTSVTYFHNKVTNMIDWQEVTPWPSYTGRYVNINKAETSGVELALKNRFNSQLTSRISYTHLNAHDGNGNRLQYRPRNVIDCELRAQVTKAALIGLGVHGVQGRSRDAWGVSLEHNLAMEDYTTVRLFGSYAVRRNLFFKARVENALDEHYADSFGYASLPVAAYGSVEWRF